MGGVVIRPSCHQCGYDLTGLRVEENCPECGQPVWPSDWKRAVYADATVVSQGSLSLVLGVLALVLTACTGVIGSAIGVVALLLGAHALRERHRRPIPGSSGVAIAGVVISSVSLVSGLVITVMVFLI